MLADRDPNGSMSGRTSRASNLSAMSRPAHKHGGGANKQQDFVSSVGGPGVMSMLRTSTEMGNIAALTGDVSGVGNVSRPVNRRGASSRLSTASSMSGASSRASRHHRQYPSSSSAARRSMTREPQYVADTLSPTVMNIPGSSPLIPTRSMRSRERDSGRSLSMTHTMQPTFRLSSNRSLGSLHSYDHVPRPRSPYHYPTRLRRPSYRSVSPALSDITGANPRRSHGLHGSQGQPYYPGQMRLRIPSDTSLGHQERMHGMPHRSTRSRPTTFYNGPHGDIPPVPPLFHHHMAVENARMVHKPGKGSFSSGSTNLRTDSDAPSSDSPSPPTPKDGLSMEVLISPTGTQMAIDTVASVVKEDSMSEPLYYDYSEQFEREQFTEPEMNAVPTGFTHLIKTIHEERGGIVEPAPSDSVAETDRAAGRVYSAVPGIAELPASPVARRITRDLILQALEPGSTTDVEASAKSPVTKGDVGLAENGHDLTTSGPVDQESRNLPLPSQDRKENRHSVLSQGGSSVMDSSTLEFAVRYSIPMVTGTSLDTAPPPEGEGVPDSPSGPGASTEDGMSDLIGGYQHSESKQEESVVPENEAAAVDGGEPYRRVESRRSQHAQKSSDEQSFKSCTDVTESLSPERRSNDQDAKSFKSCTDVIAQQEPPSTKESDARSVKTLKVVMTPNRVAPIPPSRPREASLSNPDVSNKPPLSERPLSSPAPAVLRNPHVSPRELSFSAAGSKFRTSSKPSMKQGSVSISGSSSTLSVTQQPPAVPPRESSSSKEAQRSKDVATYLMRRFMPASFVAGRKVTKEGDMANSEGSVVPMSDELAQEMLKSIDLALASQVSLEVIKAPEKVLTKQEDILGKQKAAGAPLKECNASMSSHVGPAPAAMHQHSFSSPTPGIPEASSVYSPQDSSLRSRVQSSPAGVPKSPEQNRRDSQTTTHLVWHARRSLNIPTASASESHLPISNTQDDTTTDLRLSAYRYQAPLHYLPDLKEESHEDSSLNTSASNLKNSNFRFPFGAPGGTRASVDDGFLFSRRSSVGSHRRIAAGQVGGLPSMNFSQMNLFEKFKEELGLRVSRSVDGLQIDVLETEERRPVSAGEMRDKYRSFVTQLDLATRSGDEGHLTMTRDLFALKRPCSPGNLRLMAEIDQLTIPSVGGLTQRISEILPSLREYYKSGEPGEFSAEEAIMEHTLEKVHEVGVPSQKRSSARLRPMPGSPNMVVIEDALYEELTGKEKESDGPGSHGDGTAEPSSGGDQKASRNNSDVVVTPARQIISVAELEAPSPVILRPRSLTVGGGQGVRASAESALSTRRSLGSFVSTPTATDTRPWNSDKNYPWASSSVPSVDISLPLPVAARHSPHPGPSHLRNTLSGASTATFTSTHTPTTSPFGSAPGSNVAPQSHRFSLFGRNGDVSHAAGERYPTSALTPPTAIFRDHFSTSDTSDDEAEFTTTRRSKFKLRKRFSSVRGQEHNTLNVNATTSHESTTSVQNEARAMSAANRHTFRDAEGMPSVKYHQHRFVALCRRWWHLGGDLIRTISSRRKNSSTTTV